MLESDRTLHVAIWTHRVKVSDRTKDMDEWRVLETGYQFTDKDESQGWVEPQEDRSLMGSVLVLVNVKYGTRVRIGRKFKGGIRDKAWVVGPE